MATLSIAGKVTLPPELKVFENGKQLCKFSVRDQEYVPPDPGQEYPAGQFYEVEVWGKLAEICSERLSKGSLVAVSGKSVWREFQTKSGEKARRLNVRDARVIFLDDRQAAAKGSGAGADSGSDFGIPF